MKTPEEILNEEIKKARAENKMPAMPLCAKPFIIKAMETNAAQFKAKEVEINKPTGAIQSRSARCPNPCGAGLELRYNYCPGCGSKINWI